MVTGILKKSEAEAKSLKWEGEERPVSRRTRSRLKGPRHRWWGSWTPLVRMGAERVNLGPDYHEMSLQSRAMVDPGLEVPYCITPGSQKEREASVPSCYGVLPPWLAS